MACLCKQHEPSASYVALPNKYCREIRESCINRIRGFRRYECCFTGKEAVKWLVDNQKAATPEEAVMLGNDMARAGLLHHVSFKRPFQNRKSFYRSLIQCCTPMNSSKMRPETAVYSVPC